MKDVAEKDKQGKKLTKIYQNILWE